MYTIKRAAELTGISVATLRAWERRYGVVSPQRPGGRYRSEDAEAFVRAAERLDSASATAVLDARFALGTFEHVVDDWLMPTLQLVGEEWAHGRLTVAGEHLVSYAVQRRLAAAYEAASGRVDGPTLLIGLPPGARHELGLLAFAVAARRAGFATVYVGADLPAEDWVRAIEARHAAGMVMAVPRNIDIASAQEIVDTVARVHPEVVIGLGGSEQNEISGPCVHLGHSITVAVGEMTRRLRVPA